MKKIVVIGFAIALFASAASASDVIESLRYDAVKESARTYGINVATAVIEGRKTPSLPNSILLPRDDFEREVWERAMAEGVASVKGGKPGQGWLQAGQFAQTLALLREKTATAGAHGAAAELR